MYANICALSNVLKELCIFNFMLRKLVYLSNINVMYFVLCNNMYANTCALGNVHKEICTFNFMLRKLVCFERYVFCIRAVFMMIYLL